MSTDRFLTVLARGLGTLIVVGLTALFGAWVGLAVAVALFAGMLAWSEVARVRRRRRRAQGRLRQMRVDEAQRRLERSAHGGERWP